MRCRVRLTNLWHACPKSQAAFTAVPFLLFLIPDQCLNTAKNIYIYIYTHTPDCVQTVYELPSLPNNTALIYFYTSRSGGKCWLETYRWGAGLAVTGRIRDIGLNVEQSSFETGSSSSSHSYCHIFLFIAIL